MEVWKKVRIKSQKFIFLRNEPSERFSRKSWKLKFYYNTYNSRAVYGGCKWVHATKINPYFFFVENPFMKIHGINIRSILPLSNLFQNKLSVANDKKYSMLFYDKFDSTLRFNIILYRYCSS